ncbi:MAG TPA: protein kinase, partial [Kofleriaceae bacterium]
MTAVAATHPDDNAMAAFVAGELHGAEARVIEQHMDRCDECRTVLAELARVTPAFEGRTRTDTRAGQDSTLPSGEQLDDYALGELLAERFCLVRPLGRGGMGRVYEADDLTLGIRVALKLLPKGLASNVTYLDHLHQEIRLGRRVSHPNVCRIYDLGTWRGHHFLTMELVDGETLAERLLGGALDPALGRSVARQVVAAMAAAHKENVIHRDLKPGNIMIDRKGHVKVMDFGLARDQKSAPSGRFGPVGTPGYWSPEQA